MPLEPYQQYRPSTPEATTPSPKFNSLGHSRNFSSSSTWSTPDSVGSVVSVATRATTPSVSPQKHSGHNILPKIRTQDQGLEPDHNATSFHRRAQSHDIDEQHGVPSYRPGFQRSTTSPPDFSCEAAPISATSTLSSWADSAAQSPMPFSSSCAQGQSGHGRSISTSSLDPSFRPVGNPFYRTLPVYITQDSPQYSPAPNPPSLDDFVSFPLATPLDPCSRGLTPEFTYGPGDDPYAFNKLTTYLTEPNPAVFPVPEKARGYGDGRFKHFWWDVRNIRPWDDFSLATISAVPVLSNLLNVEMKATGLPTPPPLSYPASNPQDLATLANTIKNFHIAKVNSALIPSQGPKHNVMSLMNTSQDGYYFVSNLADDYDGSLSKRVRVVGLVKPYERWNSGKRKHDGQKRVEYLQHLAHLQVLMRQHNCRYGFIITEIELVCVRLGTNPTVPDFGFLELSRPIAMTTCRNNQDADAGGLTACVALWYLNMLAGKDQIPSQCGWQIDVGPPEAQSRAQVLAEGTEGRDDWMPKVQMHETRAAKTARGWAWPEDPVHRIKEGVSSGRAKRR